MNDFLSRFSSGELIGLVSIVGGLILGTIVICAHYLYKVRETELKRELVARGMSADEIKTVLDAGEKH